MRRLPYVALAITIALVLFMTMLDALDAGRLPSARAADESRAYLPFAPAATPASPAGSYTCYEKEFGMVWTWEVVTLNADGSSIYEYPPPYGSTVTGTWTYSPTIREVQFTNFRWLTATFDAPDRLWASEYLPEPGFEVALECGRRLEELVFSRSVGQ